jgi:hypothetical protein
MRKKLMSYVLAVMAFVFFVSSAVMAVSYTGSYSDTQTGISFSYSAGGTGLTPEQLTDQFAKDAVTRISAVFINVGGITVGQLDATTRDLYVFDGGALRAVFGYNQSGEGSYGLKMMNFTGADFDRINAISVSAEDIAKWKSEGMTDAEAEQAAKTAKYLLSVGVSETMLTTKKTVTGTDNKVTETDEQVPVAWLSTFYSNLSQGINHGASLDMTAGGGTSLTVSENGKQDKTYGATLLNNNGHYEPMVLATYVYSSLGFIDSVVSKQLSPKETDDNGDPKANDKGVVEYEITETVTHYNDNGVPSYVADKDGNVVNRYAYDSAGSLLFTVDANSNKTFYTAGRPSYSVNSDGGITASYYYNPNGGLNYISQFNDGNKVAMQVFRYGQMLGSIPTTGSSNANLTPDFVRNTFDKIRRASTEADIELLLKSLGGKATITLFPGDQNNTALMNKMFDKSTAEGLASYNSAMASFARNNGFSPIAQATLEYVPPEISIDGKVYKGDEVTQDIINRYNAEKAKTGSNTSEVKSGSFDPIVTTDAHEGYRIVGGVTAQVTVMERNSALCVVANNKAAAKETYNYANTHTVYDPAIVGTVNSYYDADGNIIEDIVAYRAENPDAKIYAKINAEGVNMMDGSGFKPADGEEIMIDISSLSDEELSSLSETGRGLFMGDVNKSEDGNYVMTINKGYNVEVNGKNYGGFVTGADLEAAVSEVDTESKAALNGESKYGWMNTNTAENRSIFGLVNPTQFLNDWRDGWAALAGWND